MEFKVPEMGEGVQAGELVKWNVSEGESVADDQTLCEVMTDKATVQVPSPFSGKITKLLAKEGDMVQIGQSILEYEGGEGAAKAKPAAEKPAPAPSAAPPAPTPAAPKPAPVAASAPPPPAVTAGAGGTISAAPTTRRMAREAGIDISHVPGSGPNGRVTKADIQRALANGGAAVPMGQPRVRPTFPQGGEKVIPMRGLRKKIAEKMREAKDHAAHFTFVEEADVTQLVKLRKQAKQLGEQRGVKVTYLPFIMKAMVAALKQFPMLNSTIDEEKKEITQKYFYNISLSIQTDDGLSAPVVKDVEHRSIFELAGDINDVVERTRTKKVTKADFEGGTITLTNAGVIGGLFTTPIINHPEVAILAFNKIFKKPVVRKIKGEDRIVIRDWTYFSISLDHRVVDGADAAEFMKLFIQYIENPSLLVLESF